MPWKMLLSSGICFFCDNFTVCSYKEIFLYWQNSNKTEIELKSLKLYLPQQILRNLQQRIGIYVSPAVFCENHRTFQYGKYKH